MKLLFAMLVICVFAMASMVTTNAQHPSSPDADLNQLFEDYWQFQMRRSPERATYLGDHRFDTLLFDYSEKARQEELSTYRALLNRLSEIRKKKPAASLAPSDRLSTQLFERMLKDRLELAAYPEYLMPIKQQDSPQITLGMLATYHPFNTPQDGVHYATRLRGFANQVDDLIARMNAGIAQHIVRPRITIEKSLPQIEALIADDPKDSPLYSPARSLTAGAGGEKTRKQIEASVRDAIHELKRLKAYLQKTYLPHCRKTAGICFLPDGKAWYRRLARHHTTTDLSPDEIHQIGLAELKRIHEEMRGIMKEVGFDGDQATFIAQLRRDPSQHNHSAAEIMRRHRANLRHMDSQLSKLFGTLPRISYDLKEMEPFRAPGAPAAYYYNAPDDGSRPAYFYVNTYQPETRPIYTMEALAYHEAVPGHHLQLAIAQQRKDLPKFRRFEGVTAFVEGWALYAERLGYELGGYRDPYSRFGQLTYDAWRSSRLVVDTGIHYEGWPREKAIAFMRDNTALSEQNIVSEVDRYIAWPGQALAYKIGQLEILKLRHQAEQVLGKAFDLRAFHDHLLAEGALPLLTLRQRMSAWIRQQASAGPGNPRN